MSAGTKATAAGTKATSAGTKATSAGTKATAAGTKAWGRRILNIVPSKETHKDWKIEKALKKGLLPKNFPKSLDLRKDWWDIGDQHDTGSCVGWASTDGLLRWHLVKEKKIKKTDKLSVRFTWMASKETDKYTDFAETFLERTGSTLKGSLDVLRKFGCVRENVLPFKKGFVPKKYDTEDFYELAGKFKIKSYYCLRYDKKLNLDHFKRWLKHRGPILAKVDMDDNFLKLDKAGHKNETLHKYLPGEERGHAVTIVGYTKDYFIIRNIFEKSCDNHREFGDKGYAHVSYDYMKKAFCEAYGIIV